MLIGEIPITALNYADCVAMLSKSVKEKQHIIEAVERSTRSISLVNSMLKAEVIASLPHLNCQHVNGEAIEKVESFNTSDYLLNLQMMSRSILKSAKHSQPFSPSGILSGTTIMYPSRQNYRSIEHQYVPSNTSMPPTIALCGLSKFVTKTVTNQ